MSPIFGSKEYSIHEKFIPKSPKWKGDPGWGGCKQVLELKDLDEDTGHTVVHYLYTDLYQTLNTPGIPKDAEVEYKRSVLFMRHGCVANYGQSSITKSV